MITPAQCRAARALMNWTQAQLADVSMVGKTAIRDFESGRVIPQWATMDLLERTFNAAGISFDADVNGCDGVRLAKRKAD